MLRCRYCGTEEVVELDSRSGEMVRTRPEIEWSQIDDALWLACSTACREGLGWRSRGESSVIVDRLAR